MADGFLRHYGNELQALRGRAARFARAHPKIAGRLRLSPDTSDDPHVERLIQSFAYVAARTRQKIEDELPELTDGMLETLYPHYLAPVPPMTLVEMHPRAGLDEIQTVPRHSTIVSEPVDGEECRFRTARSVAVAPVRLAGARLMGHPIEAPQRPSLEAAGCLRLDVARLSGPDGAKGGSGGTLAALNMNRLRVHIRAPWREALALHELLTNRCVGVAVARHAEDAQARFLPPERLAPCGFDASEALLPFTASGAPGYRLLSEFFALPEAFLAFEVDGLAWPDVEAASLYIYTSRAAPELERAVSAAAFALHVTPAVNLFTHRAEPVRLEGAVGEHPLVPDARHHATREIYAVEHVEATDGRGRKREARPFFSEVSLSGGAASAAPMLWQMVRRPNGDGTTDAAIAFVDGAGRPLARSEGVASVDVLCFNRDLPARLPFAAGRPRLALGNAQEAVGGLTCLMAPTTTLRVGGEDEGGRHGGRSWRLVSHLSLNHLSLGDEDGAAMRAILRLYALRDTPEIELMVQSVRRVETKPATARMAGGVVVSGTNVTITFDSARIDRPTAYLFASVLERFLGLYAAMNSFTRLTARLSKTAEPVARWPARAAQRPLV